MPKFVGERGGDCMAVTITDYDGMKEKEKEINKVLEQQKELENKQNEKQ